MRDDIGGIGHMMVGSNMAGKRRTGKCGWCGRHKEHLRYTVYVADGAYHAANLCETCLAEYRESLRQKITEGGGE